MTRPPAEPSHKHPIDVRTLNVVQLRKLAERGSRRAKAELEGRMRAAASAVLPEPPEPPVPRPAAATAPPAPARADPPAAGAQAVPSEALLQQLELIAGQNERGVGLDGPPRLVGMALIGWAVLMMLGALLALGHGGGVYYVVCAVGLAAVGGLLLRCSRWALFLHGALALLALGWAWRGAGGGLVVGVVQAAPVLLPGLWMAARQVREVLE